MSKYSLKNKKIAVIGLGYVGLPLAVEFGKIRKVVGLDLNDERIIELKAGIDSTLEIDSSELKSARQLIFSNRSQDIYHHSTNTNR